MMPYFLAVARAGSLRSAARLLNANYGTVNRNIQALEASYGVMLFQRSQQGFSLTAAGEALLPAAEETERSLIAGRRQVEGLDRTETGTVRFSLTNMLAYDLAAPIISRFQQVYPGIDIEMRVTSEVEDIPRAETDVSLRAAHEVTGDVVARKLYALVTAVLAGKSYLDQVFPTAGPGGAGLTWIGSSHIPDMEKWVSQSPFPRAGTGHRSADGFMLLSLLRYNCGMSRMPVVFEKIYPDLQRVPGTELAFERPLWIVLHSDLRRTVRVRRFVDFLTKEMLGLQKDMQAELFRAK
jgi:DNA-binding transcriptional LysR family regulator